MEEIIYRVYMENWGNVLGTKLQYIAALQGGKDLKSLRSSVNNDTLEGLAGYMAREVFRFHYEVRRDSQEVGFAFDLPYAFKVREGGEIGEPRRLHENQEKVFKTQFKEAYHQQLLKLHSPEGLRGMRPA